jgi:hypothetical protein
MNNLFETELKTSHPAILVIDASGSVKATFQGTDSIFNKMEKIISNMNFEKCRCIFWNSNNSIQSDMSTGIFKLPYVIEKTKISQPFSIVQSKITPYSLTYPHLGFDELIKTPEWFHPIEPTHIYFVTDGQIGYGSCSSNQLITLKNNFVESIRKLFTTYTNVHLHIITVEATIRNFNNYETLNISAGGDMFQLIQNNNMTNLISSFVSFTPTELNGYTHIKRVIAPPGYIAFGTKFFSELKIGQFINWLKNEISTIMTSESATIEDDLLRIIQDLSQTLKKITTDKSPNIVDSIYNTFCSLFESTPIDSSMVKFIIIDSIAEDKKGKVTIFSQYRSKLKDLYKQANESLTKSTSDAVGLSQGFITFPIDNLIISGHGQLVKFDSTLSGAKFPKSSVKLDDLIIPVIPIHTNLNSFKEQCMRQYIRAIIGTQYDVDKLGDIVIYIVMALNVKIQISNIPESIKNIYKSVVNIMLRKKRLNSDQTELSRLIAGEPPIPNTGNIEQFYSWMAFIGDLLELPKLTDPMIIWYILCQEMANNDIKQRQLIHCRTSISTVFPEFSMFHWNEIPRLALILMKETIHIQHKQVPIESFLDYYCLITLEDTSNIGGYRIIPHTLNSNSSHICVPHCVFSIEGHVQILKSKEIFCPICYSNLTADSFEKVGPKIEIVEKYFNEDIINPFGKKIIKPKEKYTYETKNIINTSSFNNIDNTLKRRILIKLKGTVGSGKTTYGIELQNQIKLKGWTCLVEGTDKYCKTGMKTNKAIKRVNQELTKIKYIKTDLIVIIDTCGEQHTGDICFGYNFSGWEIHELWPNYKSDFDVEMKSKYLKWSLSNVLKRPLHSNKTNHYLNPISAGVETCISVHSNKYSALVGSNPDKITNNSFVETILVELKKDTDEFSNWLNENMDLKLTVSNYIKNILNIV